MPKEANKFHLLYLTCTNNQGSKNSNKKISNFQTSIKRAYNNCFNKTEEKHRI